MRIRTMIPLLAVAALIGGCHKGAPAKITLGAAFRTLPLPPDAQALASEGGVDAMQLVLVSPVTPDSMLGFYRNVLSADPFHLVNERTSGKSTALYAEQQAGPPIWITISPNGTDGSQVVIAGAKDQDRPNQTPQKVTTADSGAASTLPVKKP